VSPGSLRWRLLFPFVLSTLFGLTSCATDPPSPLELAGQRATVIVVAPFNIALPLPDSLEDSTKMVADALLDHLESKGKSTRLVDREVGNSVWLESIDEVNSSGGSPSFESAIRIFVRKIQQRMAFDAIIIPSLYIQNAASNSEVARWDRTGQKIEFRGRARKEIEMPPPTTIRAASLLLYVFDAAGEQIHTKRTGLELIQHMTIRVEKKQGYDKRIWTLKDDDPAIESEVRVRAAVAHSLYPFIPK